MKTVYHISDIHIRCQDRHDEYRNVFNNLYNKIEKNNLIVIAGDLYHDKAHITASSLILFKELMINLSSLCEIIIIDGNHDVNINNIKRKSNIEASLKELKTENNIHYLTEQNKSVKIDNMNFILTVMNGNVEKIIKKKGEVYIALYHGTLNKCIISENYEIEDDKYLKVEHFKDYDIVMLGDIHKHQFLNKQKSIGYASSLIQQNYGEEINEHGMIVWNIEKKKGKFVEIENEVCYVKCYLTSDGLKIPDIRNKKKLNIELNYEKNLRNNCENEIKKLKENYEILNYYYNEIKEKETKKENNVILLKNVVEVYKEFVKNKNLTEDNEIIEILSGYIQEEHLHNKQIKLIKMKFNNLFSYGEHNEIIFENLNNIVMINGLNGAGKSTILDVILFILFDRFSKGKSYEALNIRKKSCDGILELNINGAHYKIIRKISLVSNKHFPSIQLFKNGENISAENKLKTDKLIKDIVGEYETFILTNILLQNELDISSMSDKDKMKILFDLLNINKYEEIKKTIDKQKNILNREIIALQKETNIYLTTINEKKNVANNINTIENEINDLNIKIKEITKKKCKIEYNIENINITNNDLEDIENKIKSLNKQLKKIENSNLQNKDIEIELNKLNEEITELKKNVKNITIDNNIDISKLNDELTINKKNIEKTKKTEFKEKLILKNENEEIINITEDEINKKYEINKKEKELEIENNKINISNLTNTEKELLNELTISKNKDIIKSVCDTIISFNSKCKKCNENKESLSKLNNCDLEKVKDEKKILKEIKKLNIENEKTNLQNNIQILKYLEKDKNNEIDKNENINKKKEYENKKKEFEINKEKSIITLEKEKINLENEILKYESYNKDVELINLIKKKEKSINKKKEELQFIEENINNINNIKNDISKYTVLKNDLIIYNEKNKELQILIADEKNKEKLINEKKQNEKELNKKYGEIIGVEDIYNEKIKKINDNKLQYNKIIKIIDLYEKNNFIGYIIDNYINNSEEIINNVLMSMVDYKVKLIQENDELKIYKMENEIMINIRQLSGNEKFLINIAVKIAFNKISISLKTNFFFIDEAFVSCDVVNISKLHNLFDILNKEFDFCLIISHIESIKNEQYKNINIKRNDDGFSYIVK